MTKFQKFFYRPPYIGLLGFVIVLLVQALGHTVMIVMENMLGPEHVLLAATLMGFAGAVMLYIGMKGDNEVTSTWLGFFAGTFLWTGWVEFSFIWNATTLGVADLMVNGEVVTKAEYLIMPSSIGVMLATLAYFIFNKETKCNFFHWFQRNLYMSTGRPTRGHKRNFAAITCLETIYVVWFCYLLLLLIYDERILGDTHPVTYGLFFINTVWSIYLLNRLLKFWKVTTAIRYAIPTAIITWNSVELLGRWHVFTEIWVHPEKYILEMGMVFGAFVIVVIVSMMTPQHAKQIASQD